MKKQLNIKKLILLNLPYILMGLFSTNFGEAWRMAVGADASAKMLSFFSTLPVALASWWPSLHPLDLLVGLCCGGGLRLAVYLKSKNAKKYRHGMEYGSARWGTHEDITPYIDPVFQNNVILTKTESLTMNSRPKDPKTARNKNVLVIGGSGSGKTRFWLKPNLMQMHSSYVVTDPKGTILVECGKMLQRGAPKLGKDGKPMKDKHGKVIYEPYRIKVLNTINFKKSMHYNPFAYIHSEKDILKLVTTLIANTKGEGKAGDDFWVKAETLLYCALIGYIHYEAPVEEQNFSTLIEFINAMEVREDDEEFKNPVDLMFDALEAEKPNHFAVRHYKKYKDTEDRLNEALRKARHSDELKSIFLANMSHEIRTPLNAIVGFSSLLAYGESDLTKDDIIEFTSLIEKNSQLLMVLISDILDLSKIESNTMEFNFCNISLHQVLNEIGSAQRMNMKKGVELLLDLPGQEVTIYTDPTRLSQVINNLVNNAIKFTSEGNIRIGYRPASSDRVKIFVEDTGTGMAKEVIEHIFDRFYKGDAFKQGTGLGLAICRTIVERFKGKIEVASTPGKGTRFTITLPLKVEE